MSRGRPKKLDEEQREEIAEGYRDGLTIDDLIEKYDIAKKTVRRYLQEQGVEMRDYGFTLTSEDKEEIKRLAREGLSEKEIAREMKKSKRQVNSILEKSREEHRLRVNVLEDFESGYDILEISGKYDIDYHEVVGMLRDEGISLSEILDLDEELFKI